MYMYEYMYNAYFSIWHIEKLTNISYYYYAVLENIFISLKLSYYSVA